MYQHELTLAGAAAAEVIDGVLPQAYGVGAMHADGAGRLYLWLPASLLGEASLTAGGRVYKGELATVANDTGATTLAAWEGLYYNDGATGTAGLYYDDAFKVPYTGQPGAWSAAGSVLALNGFAYSSADAFALLLPRGQRCGWRRAA